MTDTTKLSWINAARRAAKGECLLVDPVTNAVLGGTGECADLVEADEHAEREGHLRPESKGIFLDATTASLLIQLYDRLNPVNQERLAGMTVLVAVDLMWKLNK